MGSKIFFPYETDLNSPHSSSKGLSAVESGVKFQNGRKGEIERTRRMSIGDAPLSCVSRELDAWSDYFSIHVPDAWITLTHWKKTGKKRSLQYLQDYLNSCARDKRIKSHLIAFVCGDWQRKRIANHNEYSWHHHIGLFVERRGREIKTKEMFECLIDRWSDNGVSLGRVMAVPYRVELGGMMYSHKKHSYQQIHYGCYGPARCRKSGCRKRWPKKGGISYQK